MIYRQIYEDYYGPIPKELNGRSYEIHHKDGVHANNDINNFQCVTLEDHYNIHYHQGDYRACQLMALRMNKSQEEISKLASLAMKKRIEDGNFHIGAEFQNKLVKEGKHHLLSGDIQRKNAQERLENGTHNFIGFSKKRVEKGTHNLLGPESNQKRLKNGTHNLTKGNNKQIENGTHSSLIKHICPYCGKEGKGNIMFRYHFDNCKLK